MLRRLLSQLSRLCLLASPLATATPTTVPSLVRGSLSHEGRCDPQSARHWWFSCAAPPPFTFPPLLSRSAAPQPPPVAVAPAASPSTWRLPTLFTARCATFNHAADVDHRCSPHHSALPRLPCCLSLLQCTTMLRPTRVLRCRNAAPSPPLSLDSSGFDLYEPGTWVQYGGNHATPDAEKILALTNYLEQQKTQLLKKESHWEIVRSNIPHLFDIDPTVAQAAVATIKTFLQPKPSGLPPLIEKINKLKATPWYKDHPAGGVGFAGSLVLGLEKSDTKRFVLPESLANVKIKHPVFKWKGVPRSFVDVTKEHDSVLVVTGESGGGKTMVLLLLLKAMLKELRNLFGQDEKTFADSVAAVTLYVTPNKFRSELEKVELDVCGGLEYWLWEGRQFSAKEIETLSYPTKRLLYHLVDLTPDEKQKGFAQVAEDTTLRAALKSWKTKYEPTVSTNHDGSALTGAEQWCRKIVRNYVMYEVLVEGARSRLQKTREGDLLPALLATDSTPTLYDASGKVYPSAMVVLAVDEIGGDAEASRAVCAVREEVYAALFGESSNVLFRVAVAGTGLAASILPPGSKPGDYYVHHVQPSGIFEAHMQTLFYGNDQLCTRLISAVREQPYFNSLTQNARMAALFAKQLKHVFQFTLSIPEGTVKDWVVSNAELQTAAMLAAKEFKQLNGLTGLQIATAEAREDSVLGSLLRAMALHMVPYPNNDETLRNLCGTLGLVTDRATWEKSNKGDVYVESANQFLTCSRGSSRYELNRGILSTLSLLVFGFIPRRTKSGEGLEAAAAMTVLLIVAAMRDMPMEALKWVLRYGAPLTPGSLGMTTCKSVVHFNDVCKAMQWEQPAAAQTKCSCFLTELCSTDEETEFINKIVSESGSIVGAALSPPKASFADAVVGLKKHNDKSNGLLVLIQSKDLKNSLSIYEFFYENHKMGHRGVQSIAGYLAKSAPFFGLKPKKGEKPGMLLQFLCLQTFDMVPWLEETFQAHWKKKMEGDQETMSAATDHPWTTESMNANPLTSPTRKNHANALPTDQDRIAWLCSYKGVPHAEIFEWLSNEAGLNRLKNKFKDEEWAALPFVAPCEQLEVLKAAYGAQHVMFATYCTSESVPRQLRMNSTTNEVRINWGMIRDNDIGIILSDSKRLLCTLPTNEESIRFQATVGNDE